FLGRALPNAPAPLLEVGAGDGAIAAGLRAAGYDVVAIDPSADAVARARERGVMVLEADFLGYDAEPYDAVLFTRSLHHLHPLADAVARARALTRPGGHLVAEEFAFERMDHATARWLADQESGLAAEGLVPERPSWGGGDPLERWVA